MQVPLDIVTHWPLRGSQTSFAMQSDGVLMQFFRTQTCSGLQVSVVGLHSSPFGHGVPFLHLLRLGLFMSRSQTKLYCTQSASLVHPGASVQRVGVTPSEQAPPGPYRTGEGLAPPVESKR